MKKIHSLIALASLLAISAFAGGNEITITGEGMCAMCMLHETHNCQTAIQTHEDGKTVTYYLAKNAVSKRFHDNICKQTEEITATGTLTEENGKKILTPSKIERVK
jgi:hypothetical protein